ncbi:MAG: hypothetical protein JWO38_4874 [Gemmataceae bacterium]|nr:hypothetical protein [Gemmataceae bacterium]
MAAGSGAIRAGAAFVELFLQDNMLTRGLDSAKKRLQSWGGAMTKVGATMAGAGAGVLAPIGKVFTDAVSRGDQIQTLAKRFGSTTESVSALAFGFERAGVGLDQFGDTIGSLEERISHAADSNDELIEGLRGLKGRDLLNLPIDEQLDKIAEKIKGIPVAADRLRAADSLGMKSMLPWLEKGAAGLDELRDAAKDAGAVMDPEQADQSKQIMKAYTATWQQLKYGVLQVGMELLPTGTKIANLSEHVRKGISDFREWIKENRGIVVTVAAVAAGLVAGGMAFMAFGAVLSTAGTVLGAVSTGIGLIGSGLGLVLSPIGLVSAAVVGLGVLWATQTESGKQFTTDLKASFDSVAETAKDAWSGIVAALSSGDLELAGKIATAGLSAIWADTMLFLTKQWVTFKDSVVDGWHDITDALARGMANWMSWYEAIKTGSLDSGAKLNEDLHKQLGQMSKETAAANRKFRDEQLAIAQKARDEAKAAVGELADRARKGAMKPGGPGVGGRPAEDLEFERHRKQELMTTLFDAAKGVFSGPFNQQLGYNDTLGKRQLDAVLGINNKLAAAPQAAKDLNALVNAMRFR